MTDAYLVCATPRTGSSLLLGLLESTGVCGHPQSYFRAPDRPLWAARWGLAPDHRPAEFLAAARRAGTTPNGVFGAKLMWGALDEVPIDGDVRYLSLTRDDVVAQAVSWLRADQTGLWYAGGNGEISGLHLTGREPAFDPDAIPIPRHHRQADTLNQEWIARFRALR
ncbi:Stf0 family sulfotransferase [Actinoplanes sp. NPDC051851]|uniref:Stf0 family sulfotransferase n=1 Tax=Actinoplanes sp. NPDC051851 TaxID=3154753 RepID=UPI00343E27F7